MGNYNFIMSKLLINEPPLQVLPTLAKAIGLNKAIVLQQMHYWLGIAKIGKVDDQGVKWIRNSLPEWVDNFPFWSEKTIKRIIDSLVEDDIIKRNDRLNKYPQDRTRWYTINYGILAFAGGGDKLSPPIGQVVTPQSDNLSPTLPETTTETTTENMPQSGDGDFLELFSEPLQAKSTAKKLDDNGQAHLLTFGVLPDEKPDSEEYEVKLQLQNIGWQIHSPDVELAIVYFVLVVRSQYPEFAIPNDKGTRKDWYRSVSDHLQNYPLSELQNLYKLAIIKMVEKELSYWRPGSLTKWALPEAESFGKEKKSIVSTKGGFYI